MLESPLACGSCGILNEAEDVDHSPFAVLGLEPSFEVDTKDLKKRLRRLTRLVHPDFFATASQEELELAERQNARLNASYEIVEHDVKRADWLVRSLGGPGEKDLGCMPQAFLMEVMEWNETLDDHEPGSAAYEAMETELERERESLVADIARHLDPLPSPGDDALKEVRKSLNALRYVERALSRVKGQAPAL